MPEISYPDEPILIVDDEEPALDTMRTVLHAAGLDHVMCLQDGRQALRVLQEEEIGVLLLDLRMPHIPGTELLVRVREEHPEVPVIVITAADEVETAMQCMRNGAFDYFVKPIDKNQVIDAVKRAMRFRELQWESAALRRSLYAGRSELPEALRGIVTQNARMRATFRYVAAIATTSQPVFITGETGVGKGLMARAIHVLSGREGEFVTANMAGIDDVFFADTLFGHTKGSYTGAGEPRSGLIDRASGGTLLLDEIGDLGAASQVKLLGVLEEREYYPLGSDLPKRTDVRFLVATSRDIEESMKSGRFRKELYFRLCTHHVHLPPLRERKDDLPFLVEHFLDLAAEKLHKKKPVVPQELYTLLRLYDFPGNVRELQALVFDALSRHTSGVLSTATFRNLVWPKKASREEQDREVFGLTGGTLPTLRQSEQLLIAEAMRRSDGNQSIAARLLGISRQALNQRLKRSGE